MRYGTYHNPAIEIMNMHWGLPKRAPVYGEHGEEEDDDDHASRSEDLDVDLPRRGGRGLACKVALGEPW